MKKLLMSLLVLFVVSASYGVTEKERAYAQSYFKDVPSGYWAIEEILYLQNLKVIAGYADGRFLPGRPVTKAQAAMMMNRSLKLSTQNLTNPGFSDLPSSHPAYKDVAALVQAGIIPKTSAFRPNDVLIRGEMAKYLVNAYKLKGSYPGRINDVPADLLPAVRALAGNGITSIFTDGTYKPKDSVTRAQFSAFIARSLDPEFRGSYSVLNLFLPNIKYDMSAAEVKGLMENYTIVDEIRLPLATNDHQIVYSAKVTGLSSNEQYLFTFKDDKLNRVVINVDQNSNTAPSSANLEKIFGAYQNYFKPYVGLPKSFDTEKIDETMLYKKRGYYQGGFLEEKIYLSVEGYDFRKHGGTYQSSYMFVMQNFK